MSGKVLYSDSTYPYYAQLKLTLSSWILTQSGPQSGPENGPSTTQNPCFLGFSSTYRLESGARGRNHTFLKYHLIING